MVDGFPAMLGRRGEEKRDLTEHIPTGHALRVPDSCPELPRIVRGNFDLTSGGLDVPLITSQCDQRPSEIFRQSILAFTKNDRLVQGFKPKEVED